jgi:hypothetical protein
MDSSFIKVTLDWFCFSLFAHDCRIGRDITPVLGWSKQSLRDRVVEPLFVLVGPILSRLCGLWVFIERMGLY